MPPLQLKPTLRKFGVRSANELARVLNTHERSVYRLIQMAEMAKFHSANSKNLGFAINDVGFHLGLAFQDFSGGKVSFGIDGPGVTRNTYVQVRFIGFFCVSESNEASSSDEPYFVIGVTSTNKSKTVRFGPYGDVDGGEYTSEVSELVSEFEQFIPPIVIGVYAYENDFGTPQEAEDQVRKVFLDVEKKLDGAAAALSGAAPGSHVIPQGFRDIVIGWGPEIVAAVFGLGDDTVGKTFSLLFDEKVDLQTMKDPPTMGRLANNDYNVKLRVDGAQEGIYDLMFNVRLVDIIRVPHP